MKCPTCGHPEHRIIRTATDTATRGELITRRRECERCLKRWTTVEATEDVYDRARDIADAFGVMKSAIGDEA